MPELKKTIPLFGRDVAVADVPIQKAAECFNEYELEDGSVLKVKTVAMSIMRVEGQFTPDGSPIYLVNINPAVIVVSSKIVAPQPAPAPAPKD
jgi:hypothetical protein